MVSNLNDSQQQWIHLEDNERYLNRKGIYAPFQCLLINFLWDENASTWILLSFSWMRTIWKSYRDGKAD